MTSKVEFLIGSLVKKFRPFVACAAIAFPVLMDLAGGMQVYAQPPAAEPTIILPRFESASIKLANATAQRNRAGIFATPGGEVRAESLTLGALMWYAFDVQPYQIVGGPEWIHKDLFDVVAVPPASAQTASFTKSSPNNPLSDQQKLMLQSLLIARFQLTFHREFKAGPVFVLEKVNGKPKLHSPKDPGAAPWVGSNVGTAINGDGLVGKNVSMPVLAARLSRYLQCPVQDKTGLTESYDFKVVYPNNNPNTEEALVNSIMSSAEGLGLRLEPSTGLVDTIVVDGAEKPPAN